MSLADRRRGGRGPRYLELGALMMQRFWGNFKEWVEACWPFAAIMAVCVGLATAAQVWR